MPEQLVAGNPEEVARRARFARVRLLNEELDKLAIDAAERTASVTNKASFLAVSSGVLVAASTVQLWTVAVGFGVGALAIACLALACAAVAVRPGKRMGIQARRLVDRYADSTLSALQIESQLVDDKANALTAREQDLRSRAVWVWCGFAALALAAAALTVVFTAQVLGG
jgi:Flp pilus assembly protein TadB